MYYLPYKISLKEFSRYLRKNSTFSEVLLWNELKQAKILGYTFNRQKPLGKYIVDFYCKPLNLVIEIDGAYHLNEDVIVNDAIRQKILEEMGLQFLRFTNNEVRFKRQYVVGEILKAVREIEVRDKVRVPKRRKL